MSVRKLDNNFSSSSDLAILLFEPCPQCLDPTCLLLCVPVEVHCFLSPHPMVTAILRINFLNLGTSHGKKTKLIFFCFLRLEELARHVSSLPRNSEQGRHVSLINCGFSWRPREKNGRSPWRNSREFREDRLGDPTICHHGEGVNFAPMRIGLLYATTRNAISCFLDAEH